MSLALIPGSFDPMTLGHLDLVKRALKRYDEAVVAVMVNPDKKYLFSMEERVALAKLTVAGIPNVRVVADTGLLVDLFDKLGADAIVKGVRNGEDRAYEGEMAAWNLAHNPRAVTVLLEASDDFTDVSSSAVRAALEKGEPLGAWLAPAVVSALEGMKK